ncbi:unnamed protein product [Staurois parvus]|uniref:Uncharacterized protein n=1 Tax=Staurois parvus TaxID=386267 RepID=A0ABN9CQJ2_9NEOB|nr:unnamed protein product [Staurois parvus]
MAECGDGDSSNGEGHTGTHERLWTWQQHEEAVQGPMADYGPGSSNGRPVICQHPMTKNEHNSSVRRPESGTWQVWRWRQQQWRPYRDP